MRKTGMVLRMALVAAVTFELAGCGKQNSRALYVYAEGCFRPAVEELAETYEQKTGTRVDVDYSGCGELLAKIEQTQRGDLYVSHTPFLGALEKKGLLDRGKTAAAIELVILVQKGNPLGIHGLEDLVTSDARVALPSAEYSTTGHILPRMLKKAGLTKEMEDNVKTRTPEGSGAANMVQLGTVDAAVVWNIFATMRAEKTDMVPINKKYHMKEGVDAVTTATFGKIEMDYVRVTVASLTVSDNKKAARDFARLMVSEEGWGVWKKHGYIRPQPGRLHPALTEKTILTQNR